MSSGGPPRRVLEANMQRLPLQKRSSAAVAILWIMARFFSSWGRSYLLLERSIGARNKSNELVAQTERCRRRRIGPFGGFMAPIDQGLSISPKLEQSPEASARSGPGCSCSTWFAWRVFNCYYKTESTKMPNQICQRVPRDAHE